MPARPITQGAWSTSRRTTYDAGLWEAAGDCTVQAQSPYRLELDDLLTMAKAGIISLQTQTWAGCFISTARSSLSLTPFQKAPPLPDHRLEKSLQAKAELLHEEGQIIGISDDGTMISAV